MKILDLIPWIADEVLVNYEREFLPDDVDVYGLKKGLQAECHVDPAATVPETVDAIKDAEEKGYDAVVMACFGDIGVEIGRSHVDIPVLGPTKVGLHFAALIGHRICLLLPEYGNLEKSSRQIVVSYGFQDKVVIRGSHTSVMDALGAYDDYKATSRTNPFIKEMVAICEQSLEKDNVDVFVIGCGGIKWMRDILESELAKKDHRITVIDPVPVAIEVARTLVNFNLVHSKRGYPKPPITINR
jgi:allantoin racemase